MKEKLLNIALPVLFFSGQIFAQDVTTVRANRPDISDNLDLQAVASIFGDSRDLEDFERRLNDPDIQISNLDLNGDNRVDYLRVIEATENNTHLIILQSVLGVDTFQDVATIEVERDRRNNVTVQVVGDVYMYGPNYIYEPVYVTRPAIYNVFWVNTYRPYYSPWYWGYYPTYYTYWSPYPVYRYRNNVHVHVNTRNTYVYVNTRRSTRATNMYDSRRQNAYERQHPDNSFTRRNTNVSNRYALEQSRATTRPSRGSFTNSPSRNNDAAGRTTTGGRNNSTAPVRTSASRTATDNIRSAETPAKASNHAVRYNPSVQESSRVQQQTTSPQATSRNTYVNQRSSSPAATPVRTSNNSLNNSSSRNTPAMQQSSPARPASSNSSMRSNPAPQQRQSAPAASQKSASGSGRSRG
jgi:hypothetical protein